MENPNLDKGYHCPWIEDQNVCKWNNASKSKLEICVKVVLKYKFKMCVEAYMEHYP